MTPTEVEQFEKYKQFKSMNDDPIEKNVFYKPIRLIRIASTETEKIKLELSIILNLMYCVLYCNTVSDFKINYWLLRIYSINE